MKKDIRFASQRLTLSSGLMVISGILTAVYVSPAIGGIFWTAASCIFFSACHFRLAENNKEKAEVRA